MNARLPAIVVCSEFWRNRRGESVRIQLREFEGQVLVDLRVHYRSDGKLVPTRKGLSLVVRKLPQLLDGVKKATSTAISLGLLEGQP
jgi:hypothetical protein